MIAAPPLSAGALHVRVTCAGPATAETAVGTAGVVDGVVGFEGGDDAGLVPIAFVAVTVNVYAVPFVSPVTIIGDALLELAILPGLEVTV